MDSTWEFAVNTAGLMSDLHGPEVLSGIEVVVVVIIIKGEGTLLQMVSALI